MKWVSRLNGFALRDQLMHAYNEENECLVKWKKNVVIFMF